MTTRARRTPPPKNDGHHWLPVMDFEGLYSVEVNTGLVWNWRGPGRMMVQTTTSQGYKRVGLNRVGVKRTKRVHVMVLDALEGPCPAGLETRHRDNDPANNTRENLMRGTRSENEEDKRVNGTSRHRFTDAQAWDVYSRAKRGEVRARIAERYNCHESTISDLVRGASYRHLRLEPLPHPNRLERQ